ncbi:MAG: PAS domain S-box protein [Melioribacteraceae bacterium]|nr:PAS domain S-box protein [Melioribacteraceae bacterium]
MHLTETEISKLIEENIQLKTRIKQYEEAESDLSRNPKRYIELVNLLPIPVFEINLRGKVLFANEAAFKEFGYSIENIETGIHIMEVFPPEERERIEKYIADKYESNSTDVNEFILQKENGDKFNALIYSDVIVQNKRKVGLRGVVIDISQQKEYEAKIKEQHEQLSVKTAELEKMNTHLEKSENDLLELNNSKDVFFTIIAHELKSPFTSLLGITQLLELEFDEFEKEEIRRMISSIGGSAKGIFNLLEDLLGWARLQTGRIDYDPLPNDLSVIVKDAVKSCIVQANHKNIAIINKIETSCLVTCDYSMIKTVLRNLIINGIKFTPDFGKVEISAEENDEYITVKVEDTGIGLSADDIEKLFRIDIRATYIGKSSLKDTGMGLILCKGLVEKNGGEIRVESKPDKGSIFYFTLKGSIK